MVRERFTLLKALGLPGYVGLIAMLVFALLTVFVGYYSIANNDDRLAQWVRFPALATGLISITLHLAMERKRR